jgi:hypothetical protein
MEKLLTIYLDNSAYGKGKVLVSSFADKHGHVQEHLGEYLEQGWRVKHIAALGGAGDAIYARGWLAVALEKQ